MHVCVCIIDAIPLGPVPRKPDSSNLGITMSYPRDKVILVISWVPKNTDSVILGINFQ